MGDTDLTVIVRPPLGPALVKGNRNVKYEGEVGHVESSFILSQDIKNNKFDENYEHYAHFGWPQNTKISPEDLIKTFIEDPSKFITNVTEVENLLMNSERTKNLIGGVFGRITLPCRIKSGDKSVPGMLLIMNSQKETDVGVANGFPTDELNSHEMYASNTVTDFLQPTDNQLTVHIDAEMISSGLEMLQGSGGENNGPDIHFIISTLIDYFMENELYKYDKTVIIQYYVKSN